MGRASAARRSGCGWSKAPIGITKRSTARPAAGPCRSSKQKWQSDANFEQLARGFSANHEHLRPALGSHNIRSLAHGAGRGAALGLAAGGVRVANALRHGRSEKQALVEMGYRVRIYMPYGELIPGMAYLVRRLLENTSNDSFLRAELHRTNVRRR